MTPKLTFICRFNSVGPTGGGVSQEDRVKAATESIDAANRQAISQLQMELDRERRKAAGSLRNRELGEESANDSSLRVTLAS